MTKATSRGILYLWTSTSKRESTPMKMNDNGHYTEDDISLGDGEISYSAWEEKYKPIKNPFYAKKYPEDKDGQISFETYDEELEYVKSFPDNQIWTWVDGDYCSLLVPGLHWVNRLNYHICEVPFTPEQENNLVVLLSVEVECKCYKEEGYGPDVNGYFEDGDPECKECEGYGLKTVYLD